MVNTTDLANQIVNNLEKKGESKDYIIGFLTATLNGLRYIENEQVKQYLARTVEQTKKY